MRKRAISFSEACRMFPHRYTMDHVPAWARQPTYNGLWYAPHYKDDREWYDHTVFPGEGDIPACSPFCDSTGQTWPLGTWLDGPFRP